MSRRADLFRVTVVPPKKGEGDSLYWRIRPPHGRKGETRQSARTTDRAAAEAGARRVEDRLNRGLIRPGADPAVLEVFDRFVAAKDLAKAPAGTLKTFRVSRPWLAPMAKVPASKLSSGPVLAMRDTWEGKLAASTCNLYVGILRRSWRWAKARELVAVDFPAIDDLPEAPSQKRPLYPEEVAAVLQELEVFRGGKWLPLFRCLTESGHRVGALLLARGRDLHAHPERPWLEVTDGKSGERKRAYLLPETVAMLPPRRPDDLIFQGRAGRVAVSTAHGVFLRALELAGLEHLKGTVDVHSFRRFVVDQNCQDGESIARGMRITGHSTASIFLHYQKNARDNPHASIRRTVDRVQAALSTPSTTPGDFAEAAEVAGSHDPQDVGAGRRSTTGGGRGAVAAHGAALGREPDPPRVPPRVTAEAGATAMGNLGRSRLARVLARMLRSEPVSLEDARAALVAVACSRGHQRGVKEAAEELGLLTAEQARNTKRSENRRAERARKATS